MKKASSKFYIEGQMAHKQGLKYADCPYRNGGTAHQQWVNGFGAAGDKVFLKLVKLHPRILRGS